MLGKVRMQGAKIASQAHINTVVQNVNRDGLSNVRTGLVWGEGIKAQFHNFKYVLQGEAN